MRNGINTLAREFRNNIVKTVNESGLPACIINCILRETISETLKVEEQQINDEMKTFEESGGDGYEQSI